MATGNLSKLSMRPPSAGVKAMSVEEGAKNLELLDEWTQRPAQEIAAAIGQGVEKQEEKPVEQAVEKPAPEEVKKPAKKKEAEMPWEGAVGVRPCTFRLPVELAEKLKYLGGTTYGETITSIVIAALEREAKRLLKERNEQSTRVSSQAN